MRTAGTLDDVRTLGVHDHVCWAFAQPDEFRTAAHAFLMDGLAAGERVWLIADRRDTEWWLEQDIVHRAVADGAASAIPIGSVYPAPTVVDPPAQVKVYRAGTEAALADGYTGLRIAADATSLVRTAEQLDVFLRYEHLIDRYMAGRPFTAMCAYRRTILPGATIARLASVHPTANERVSPFHLFARPDGTTALVGELDIAGSGLLTSALAATVPPPAGAGLVLDASGLSFIDHRSLLALSAFAATCDASVQFRTRKPHLARLVQLLGLTNIQVVPAA